MPDPDSPTPQDSLKQHNLEVTAPDQGEARKTVDSLQESGVDAEITVDAEEDKRAALRADMRDEIEASVMGPGNVGPQTKGQTKGIVKWVTIFTAVGAGLLFVVGLLVWPSPTGLLASAAIGAAAGATFGYVMGGFLGPRKHSEGHPDAESRPVVGVHADTPEEIEKAEGVLGDRDVSRADRVDAAGRPAGPPSKDTRPVRGDTPT